jgi:type II secretion system protein H
MGFSGGRWRSAFTLIELVVVLVIIAVTTALVMPALWKSVGKAELRSSARSLAAQLQLAHSRAAVRSESQFVSLNVERGESRLFARTAEEESEEEGELLRFPPDVKFRSVEILEVPDLTEQNPEGLIEEAEEDMEEYKLEFPPHGIADGVRVVLEDSRGRVFTVKVEVGSGIISVLEGEEEEDEDK